ncbi:MAG TPA: YbhB/YbcL family Raf kinase inhibitor-like protein [Chitinophagaceae bacterium]|nr:YbhB/YbcL family Raf kinase inhibitor-like protein [Chitinophagaceae bacterium]
MEHVEKEVRYKVLSVSSDAFRHNGFIPEKFTCDGINVNPPLDIQHIPPEAKSLAVIVEDPDAPSGTWIHWVMWNVPVTHSIKENEARGIQGINDFKKNSYGGPCPPAGTHRYFFKVYALDCLLNLRGDTQKKQLEKAMSDHIIAFGELIGLYKR